MTFEIRPLHPDDLPALSRFLTEGFHAPVDAAFAAPDVLRWKYLEPIGGDDTPRSFVAEAGGQVVGHVGVCLARFRGPNLPPGGVTTLHMIDWLGSRAHRGVGAALMRQAHQGAQTQYVLVANARARQVTASAGYAPVTEATLFRKVLRPGYRWREAGPGMAGRLLRVARDTARKVQDRGRAPRLEVMLQQVSEFGPEIEPILEDVAGRAILTSRDPARLNHALHYPRPGISGWLVSADGGVVRGFALLNVVRRGQVRAGKLVECLLEGADRDLHHAAVIALAQTLADQGADFLEAFGSTPESAQALTWAGFAEVSHLAFTLRDRDHQIPRGATFHLSPFEADEAYT